MTLAPDADLNVGQLRENGWRLIERLASEIARYEAMYGFPSEELEPRLASGELEDTLDTCEWFIAWKAFSAVVDGRPARLE